MDNKIVKRQNYDFRRQLDYTDANLLKDGWGKKV